MKERLEFTVASVLREEIEIVLTELGIKEYVVCQLAIKLDTVSSEDDIKSLISRLGSSLSYLDCCHCNAARPD
jgi:hypothetical protein